MCQGEAQPTKDWMFPSKQFWKKNKQTRNCTELAQPFLELIRERTRFYYFVHIGRREWGAFQDIPSGIKDFSPIARDSWLLSSLKLCGYMLGTCHPWFVSVFPCGHLCPNPSLSESFVASGLQPEGRANFHQTAAPHGLQAIYLTGVNTEGTRPWELPGVGDWGRIIPPHFPSHFTNWEAIQRPAWFTFVFPGPTIDPWHILGIQSMFARWTEWSIMMWECLQIDPGLIPQNFCESIIKRRIKTIFSINNWVEHE